ncbi:MAG: N-acetyl-alpha-D-glucosaminyl L-malate synthase BshA [Planctomycetota bacterium]
MRIGILCHPSYGGSGVLATELGIALAGRGHDVHFFSHDLPFRLPDAGARVEFHRIEVTAYPVFRYPPYTQSLAGHLADLCRDAPLDIVHAHYAIPHAVAAILCRDIVGGRRPRVVTTLHGTDITLLGLDRAFYEVTRHAIRKSDAVTAVSQFLRDATFEKFRPEAPVRVIPNFVDAERFSPALRDPAIRARYARPDEVLVGHLSNFRPVKRIPDVIRTFHRIQRQVPARLVMMGDGIELEPARHLAAELGIADRVSFLGAVTEVAEILAQLDLFLLPSEHESFGLAALEAMACGVPVLASRAGGLPEVIEDGVSGALCEVGDSACMAEMALAILRAPGRLEALRAAARRRAAEVFPKERVVGLYEDLYAEVLREDEGRSGAPARSAGS